MRHCIREQVLSLGNSIRIEAGNSTTGLRGGNLRDLSPAFKLTNF